MARQTHEGEIKIHRKIITIADIDKILELLVHDQYSSEVKITLVFSNGEKISNADSDILKSAEVKSKHLQELRINAKVYDASKKSYEDRTECEITARLMTETCFINTSSISIDSNDEALYSLYYSKLEPVVRSMKKQSFPCLLNNTAISTLCIIVISVLSWIYLFARIQPEDSWFLLLFFPCAILSAVFISFVEKLYPNNEIILGEEYFYPPKRKKQILKFIVGTFVVVPILDLIVNFIWR